MMHLAKVEQARERREWVISEKKTSPTSSSALANISADKNTGCEDAPTHSGKTKVAAFAQMFW